MKLSEFKTDIHFVTLDSRKAGPGGIFVASAGSTANSRDGHDYIEQACEQGVSTIVVEKMPDALPKHAPPFYVVKNSRLLAAQLAEELAGFPSHKLTLLGVTGTNGKTTTSFMTAQLLQAAHHKSAVIGTLGMGQLDSLVSSGFTTPEAEVLSPTLKRFASQKITDVVMEVSSHALATYRADGLHFRAAAFTNLSVDHLDFHADFEDYRRAKDRLFLELLPADSTAILPVNHHLIGKLQQRILTWGHHDADLCAEYIHAHARGIDWTFRYDDKKYPISTQLIGKFNIDNMLCAVGLALTAGLTIDEIVRTLPKLTAPPGRLQRVGTDNNKPTVVVDFAHTPDALEKTISTLRELKSRKLIVVMGCGGNRDKTKRPQMGLIASTLADYTVVTSDNPRHENPESIIDEVTHDMHGSHWTRITDRREAIRTAIQMANKDDIVLIAGKGHEDTQQIGDEYHPFHDPTIAQTFLDRWHS